MEHHTTTSRAEAERLLGIAEKLLRNKDFSGCRDFAILAQETEPLLEGSDQILAVADVILASETKRLSQNTHDWYSILQIPSRIDDPDLIKKQYRRLALLLHPDKNKYPFSDSAFRLVSDAWSVLSDLSSKASYDHDFVSKFRKVELVGKKQSHVKKNESSGNANTNTSTKLPVRRSGRVEGEGGSGKKSGVGVGVGGGGGGKGRVYEGNFWTACPYCYNLYEYGRVYEGCCVRCDNENCKRAFTCSEILSMPPLVPGREAYYCCWGFFPMGFVAGNVDNRGGGGGGGNVNGSSFPKWMPAMFGDGSGNEGGGVGVDVGMAPPVQPQPQPVPVQVAQAPVNVTGGVGASSEKKKRGRPRKIV